MSAYPGLKVVFLCCFLSHFFFATTEPVFIFQLLQVPSIFLSGFQFFALLSYPLLGWLSDSYFTRYQFIKAVAVMQLIGSLGLAITGLIYGIEIYLKDPDVLVHPNWYIFTLAGLSIFLGIFALGMFESVAVQFGVDQLMGASSSKLCAFIHGFYWSMHFGKGLLIIATVVCLITVVLLDNLCIAAIITVVSLVQVIASITMLIILCCCKKNITIEPAGYNPFKLVLKVLKYSWKHKVPEKRSAFTYWENHIPPRIDLGKDKYGGPFTTEEVEDVKTFFQIFILFICLIGFHLADSGLATQKHLLYKLCPSYWILLLIVTISDISSVVVVLLGIPLLQFVLIPYASNYLPNYLHRLGLGISILLIQEVMCMLVSWKSVVDYSDNCVGFSVTEIPVVRCYNQHKLFIANNSWQPHETYCGQGNTLFLILFIPIFLRSFSYHFVFLTVLEFICAQAPLRMKGLFSGIWYATSAVHQLVIIIQDNQHQMFNKIGYFSYHGVKLVLILLFLVLYCCAAKYYCYRLRDDVVNERYLVEEVYDRELRFAEEHEKQKRAELRAIYGPPRVKHSSPVYGSFETTSSHD